MRECPEISVPMFHLPSQSVTQACVTLYIGSDIPVLWGVLNARQAMHAATQEGAAQRSNIGSCLQAAAKAACKGADRQGRQRAASVSRLPTHCSGSHVRSFPRLPCTSTCAPTQTWPSTRLQH